MPTQRRRQATLSLGSFVLGGLTIGCHSSTRFRCSSGGDVPFSVFSFGLCGQPLPSQYGGHLVANELLVRNVGQYLGQAAFLVSIEAQVVFRTFIVP